MQGEHIYIERPLTARSGHSSDTSKRLVNTESGRSGRSNDRQLALES